MARLENVTILLMHHHHGNLPENGQIRQMNLHRELEKEPILAINRPLVLHAGELTRIVMHPQLERLESVPIQATNHHQEPIEGEQIPILMKSHKGGENDMILTKVHNEIPLVILTNQMTTSQKVKWLMVEKLESIPRLVFIVIPRTVRGLTQLRDL